MIEQSFLGCGCNLRRCTSGFCTKLLKKMLRDEQFGEKFDLIFLSAAGNDVIGPEIKEIPLVNNKREFPGAYGRDLINLNFYAKLDRNQRSL